MIRTKMGKPGVLQNDRGITEEGRVNQQIINSRLRVTSYGLV